LTFEANRGVSIRYLIEQKRIGLSAAYSKMEFYDAIAIVSGVFTVLLFGALLGLRFETLYAIAPVSLMAGGVFSASILMCSWLAADRRRRSLTEEWSGFYRSHSFVAPSGELVKGIGGSADGKSVTVVYGNGDQSELPLALLSGENVAHLGDASTLTTDEQLFLRMSKVKWKTLAGEMGVVRSAKYRYEADAELTLCLDSGEVRCFKLPDLEPVVG
jgi:hypothetical protein